MPVLAEMVINMSDSGLIYTYDILPNDLESAGAASSAVKKLLGKIGASPMSIKKAAISMYEAEINAVIHADGGQAIVELLPDKVIIKIADKGPGIPNVDLAMQEGWSTATSSIREMGFGAGLGLPNMKKYADGFAIETTPGVGTTVTLEVNLKG